MPENREQREYIRIPINEITNLMTKPKGSSVDVECELVFELLPDQTERPRHAPKALKFRITRSPGSLDMRMIGEVPTAEQVADQAKYRLEHPDHNHQDEVFRPESCPACKARQP